MGTDGSMLYGWVVRWAAKDDWRRAWAAPDLEFGAYLIWNADEGREGIPRKDAKGRDDMEVVG